MVIFELCLWSLHFSTFWIDAILLRVLTVLQPLLVYGCGVWRTRKSCVVISFFPCIPTGFESNHSTKLYGKFYLSIGFEVCICVNRLITIYMDDGRCSSQFWYWAWERETEEKSNTLDNDPDEMGPQLRRRVKWQRGAPSERNMHQRPLFHRVPFLLLQSRSSYALIKRSSG